MVIGDNLDGLASHTVQRKLRACQRWNKPIRGRLDAFLNYFSSQLTMRRRLTSFSCPHRSLIDRVFVPSSTSACRLLSFHPSLSRSLFLFPFVFLRISSCLCPFTYRLLTDRVFSCLHYTPNLTLLSLSLSAFLCLSFRVCTRGFLLYVILCFYVIFLCLSVCLILCCLFVYCSLSV